MSEIATLTEETFTDEVLESTGSVVVDFWAPWCGPCRALAPAIERLAHEQPSVKVVKLNVDAAPGRAPEYGVQSIPTVIRFEAGHPVARVTGALPYERLTAALGIDPLEQRAA
jgi:thioredoxin 1